MNYKLVLLIILSFILINILLDKYLKYKFKKENFPPNIVYPIKGDIELPLVEEGKNIPKKIYRCHRDKESIKKYQKVFDKTNKLMPDYEQVIYDDEEIEEFIKENFSERIFKAYNSINPIYGPAKSDLFRMLIIYLYGGVYFDIKTGPNNKNINKLIDENQDKLLISVGQNFPVGLIPNFYNFDSEYDNWSSYTGTLYNEYVQWYVISPAGNKIIKKTIEQIVSNIEYGLENKEKYNKGNISVVAMTGPIAFSLVVNKFATKKNSKFFGRAMNRTLSHSLVEYKKIEKGKHYRYLEDKRVLI